MFVTIRGRRWQIVEAKPSITNSRGECDHPNALNKMIRIHPRQDSEQERLDTIIHEVLHAALWDLSEEAIAETATDLTIILSRLGYQRAS